MKTVTTSYSVLVTSMKHLNKQNIFGTKSDSMR